MPHHAMDRTQTAERDKLRPFGSRQIPILSRLVEDTKLKGMFLVTLTIFSKK